MERDASAVGGLEAEVEGLKERLVAMEKELAIYRAAEAKRAKKD